MLHKDIRHVYIVARYFDMQSKILYSRTVVHQNSHINRQVKDH